MNYLHPVVRVQFFYSLRGFSLCRGLNLYFSVVLLYAELRLNLQSHGNCMIFIHHIVGLHTSISLFFKLCDFNIRLIMFETSAVPVEGEHAACDGHVHWHLSRHPANHKHLLPRVGVEGRVVDVLCSPELILRQARLHCTRSGKKKRKKIKTVIWWDILNIIYSSHTYILKHFVCILTQIWQNYWYIIIMSLLNTLPIKIPTDYIIVVE